MNPASGCVATARGGNGRRAAGIGHSVGGKSPLGLINEVRGAFRFTESHILLFSRRPRHEVQRTWRQRADGIHSNSQRITFRNVDNVAFAHMMTADRILNPSSLWRHILAAVSSSGSTKVAHATTPHALRLFSSSISSTYAAPVPPRTLPTSQLEAKTTISRTAVEQATKYPRHPLNQFFHFVTPRTEGGLSIPKAVIPGLDFGRGTSSRSWRAPELRRKSSMELHQLWYILAMERNRLATKWDELKRAGAKNNVLQLGETIRVRMKQVSTPSRGAYI